MLDTNKLPSWNELFLRTALTIVAVLFAAVLVSQLWNWAVVNYYHWTTQQLDIQHTAAILLLARVIRSSVTLSIGNFD
jgi:hypothetical protein